MLSQSTIGGLSYSWVLRCDRPRLLLYFDPLLARKEFLFDVSDLQPHPCVLGGGLVCCSRNLSRAYPTFGFLFVVLQRIGSSWGVLVTINVSFCVRGVHLRGPSGVELVPSSRSGASWATPRDIPGLSCASSRPVECSEKGHCVLFRSLSPRRMSCRPVSRDLQSPSLGVPAFRPTVTVRTSPTALDHVYRRQTPLQRSSDSYVIFGDLTPGISPLKIPFT